MMLVRFIAVMIVFLLSSLPATVVGQNGQSPAGSQHSNNKSQDSSFRELLEFLGQWETDDGKWVDPTDLDWLLTPEQESENDQKKNP
ncbi:MAG: hypothetical protein LJE87_16110 [Deltaproteobacteria bacterium]|jgi:hypothetical protein|nr:hypothetical protein [Deltaproteobacteria bacterium]